MAMGKEGTIALVIVAIAVAYYTGLFHALGLFSVIGQPPDCVFTAQNNTCTLSYELPAGKQAVSEMLLFQFGFVPSENYSEFQTLNYLMSVDTREEGTSSTDYVTSRLYAAPQNWSDVAEITMKSTTPTRVICNRDDFVRIHVGQYVVQLPWFDGLPVGTDAQTDANPTGYLIESDRDSSGDDYTSYHNLYGQRQSSANRCSTGTNDPVEDFTKDVVIEGVMPYGTFPQNPASLRFLMETTREIDVRGGTATILANPVVEVAYKKAEYPSNLNYKVGSFNIETIAGVHKDNKTSLDVRDQVNMQCNRRTNAESCTWKLTITSSTPGQLWVDKTETLKLWTDGSDVPVLPSTTNTTTTVTTNASNTTNTSTTGTAANPSVSKCVDGGGSYNPNFGSCTFKDGKVCNAWDYFYGRCSATTTTVGTQSTTSTNDGESQSYIWLIVAGAVLLVLYNKTGGKRGKK